MIRYVHYRTEKIILLKKFKTLKYVNIYVTAFEKTLALILETDKNIFPTSQIQNSYQNI